jgi:two-component system chemotaxis sensor kinase CheA
VDENLKAVVEDFVIEAQEHLENIESELLQIEENGANIDEDLVNKVFRGIHSIKGVAGFIGLTTIGELSHVLESVLDLIRKRSLVPTSEIVDVLLQAADRLRNLISDVEGSNDEDVAEHVAKLQAILDGDAPAAASPAGDASDDVDEDDAEDPAGADGTGGTNYELALPLSGMAIGLDVPIAELPARVAALGRILEGAEELESACKASSAPVDPVVVLLESDRSATDIAAALALPENAVAIAEEETSAPESSSKPTAAAPQGAVDGAAAPAAKPAKKSSKEPGDPEAKKAAASGDSTIRVQVRVLDRLMNLAGELVLSRNQLLQTISGSVGTEAASSTAIAQVAARVDQVTSELQGAVMQTRMQPIGNVFSRFPRVVRDLSAKLGKQCDLTIEGKEVDLDKNLIEAIGDPLTHLVRNAIDHGLETPSERAGSGKNPTGKVVLRAFHQGGKVNISISDDGRGIDPEKLKASAIKKGLITEAEAASMTKNEAQSLIFKPGFSTAAEVTDVSGRGVGMDVVRSNLEALGGTVEIDSDVGVGTTITVKIPLTLAILAAMVVGCGDQRYAIPQANIRELVRVRYGEVKERINRIRGHEVLRLRGHLLPIVRLADALGMASESDRLAKFFTSAEGEGVGRNTTTPSGLPSAINIIVVESGAFLFGIVVDASLDAEEIVAKPLGRHLKSRLEYAGATILGDGTVAMILDITGLATQMQLRASQTDTQRGEDRARASLDTQSLVLFRNNEDEDFALPAGLVSRIDRIRTNEVYKVGDREAYEYRNRALPLLRIDEHVRARPMPQQDSYSVVVVAIRGQEVGLLVPQLRDIRNLELELDDKTFCEPGVCGSFQLEKTTVRLVDVHGIVEGAFPQWFEASTATDAGEGSGHGGRILLAEDSDFFRTQLTKFIREAGYDVIDVADGQKAWDRLVSEQGRFDALVTDLEMPNLDGLGLTRRVRGDDRFSELPIMAVTSLASEDDMRRGREAGVDSYQVKLDKQAMLDALRGIMRVHA